MCILYFCITLRSLSVSHTLIQYGAVPLEIAAQEGHTKTVQRLLEAGANVNHQNKVMTVNVKLPCKIPFRNPVHPSVYKLACKTVTQGAVKNDYTLNTKYVYN